MGFMDIFKRKNKMQSLPAARNVTNDRKQQKQKMKKIKRKMKIKLEYFLKDMEMIQNIL